MQNKLCQKNEADVAIKRIPSTQHTRSSGIKLKDKDKREQNSDNLALRFVDYFCANLSCPSVVSRKGIVF